MICKGAKRPENHVRRFPVERRRRRRQKGCISHARKGGCTVLSILAPYIIKRRPPKPSAAQPLSNLRTLEPARACQTSGPLGPSTLTPKAAYITPSEPARSAGGTHRSVRQHMTDRTRAPKAPEPGPLLAALLLFPSKTTTLKTENIERKCFLWIPPARRRGCFPIRLL